MKYTRHRSGPDDPIRKDVIRSFGELGLRITIQTNLKVADFLDVTLNLNTESYYPYRKPNDRPVCIHCQSNHPPNIIKNIPASISRRLTDISSNEAVFEDAKPMYDNALADSGFGERTEFLSDRKDDHEKKKRKNRRRNITWFNPPFSRNVASNIGWRFRALVNKHFPKGSKLNKIFNRNTLKLSYSCMPNMSAVIRQHNSSILKDRKTESENFAGGKSCNCRVKDNCPLHGKCQSRVDSV